MTVFIFRWGEKRRFAVACLDLLQIYEANRLFSPHLTIHLCHPERQPLDLLPNYNHE